MAPDGQGSGNLFAALRPSIEIPEDKSNKQAMAVSGPYWTAKLPMRAEWPIAITRQSRRRGAGYADDCYGLALAIADRNATKNNAACLSNPLR